MFEEMSKVRVPANKPIVGDGIFDVESGLSVDTIEKFKRLGVFTFCGTFAPELVGAKPLTIILGKGAGKANVQYYLDKHGISLDEDALSDLVQQIKARGRAKKGNVSEEEFLIMVNEIQKN